MNYFCSFDYILLIKRFRKSSLRQYLKWKYYNRTMLPDEPLLRSSSFRFPLVVYVFNCADTSLKIPMDVEASGVTHMHTHQIRHHSSVPDPAKKV